MVRRPKQPAAGKTKASSPAKAGRWYAPPRPAEDVWQEGGKHHLQPGRARQGLPPKAAPIDLEQHYHATGQRFIPRQGVLPAEVFEEMVMMLFPSKRAFSEYTGVSTAQVQRYCTARQPVPRQVAILILCMAAQQRHGLPLPDVAEWGIVPG